MKHVKRAVYVDLRNTDQSVVLQRHLVVGHLENKKQKKSLAKVRRQVFDYVTVITYAARLGSEIWVACYPLLSI